MNAFKNIVRQEFQTNLLEEKRYVESVKREFDQAREHDVEAVRLLRMYTTEFDPTGLNMTQHHTDHH